MNANAHTEPEIPPALRRPLGALWISLGLHAALIGLVRLDPPRGAASRPSVIEARLVSTHAAPTPNALQPTPAPTPAPAPLKPVVAAEAVPVAPTVTALPVAAPVPAPASVPAAPPTAETRPSVAEPAAGPATPLSSGVDLTYYNARELDVQPRALREIVPGYPDDADRAQLSGKVRLQLKLEADGRVTDVRVVSATPQGRFEESAIEAFRDARFSPAQKDGRPVRALILIEVVYDWYGQRR